MKTSTFFSIIIISGVAITFALTENYHVDWGSAIIVGILGGICAVLFSGAFMEINRRERLGIDVFASLKYDPEEVKRDMMYIMKYGHPKGIVGALNEFNDIFRNYPEWHLKDWEVFRAWYKYEIDHMLQFPGIYVMTMKKDGSAYSKEKDPLYDPNAPDWEKYEGPKAYDDDDDDDDDDDFNNSDHDLKKAAEEGFLMGVGFGIAKDILKK